MWTGLKRFLLGSALLLLPLSFSWSAEGECELLLQECETLLETMTSELENSLELISGFRSLTNSQGILIQDQRSMIFERDERLRQVETSFNDYVREETLRNLRSAGIAAGCGLLLGVVLGLVLN